MKNLKECIDTSFATPGNTTGIGGIIAPEGDKLGSGDFSICKRMRKLIKKKRKNNEKQ